MSISKQISGLKSIFIFVVLLSFSSAQAFSQIPSVNKDAQGYGNMKEASYALIRRQLPDHFNFFRVEYIPKSGKEDLFEIESKNGKIILRGNNGVSIASALNYYLKNYANCQVTWNGTNLKLPARLPVVPEKIAKSTPYDYRYYLNYCTFSYSMSWWDWARWEKEIDWMALHGINLPLALAGQNAVWYRVYKGLGFTDRDLSTFFPGPAWFGWFWMGNLDGLGGPLSKTFIAKQEALQKKILDRERSLGMTPVLPAFTGHVPPAFKSKFPYARLRELEWSDDKFHTYLLDPTDSLFTKIGTLFMQEQTKTFGTDHFYSADTFNENLPPTNDSTFLSQISSTVYKSMASVDTQAVWIMQGWLFINKPKFWQPAQIKALFNAVPHHKMIVLDLWSETRPVWSRTSAYYGTPWIWCMLHNFGGNVGMFGKMDVIATIPSQTLHAKESGSMTGIGLTPEGIEQNPVMYELMMDNVWTSDSINLDNWLYNYVSQRYGKALPEVVQAWQILRKTVYNGGDSQGAPESIITGRPTFNKDARWTYTTKLAYAPKDLLPAWKLMNNSSSLLKNSDGFQYDIVDLTRQVLATYGNQLQQEIALDYNNKDLVSFKVKSAAFLELMDDIDRLLLTRKDFLLGKWIADARRLGANKEEKLLFERDAKTLITVWSHKEAGHHEYACKQWAGMIKNFYRPRWEQFFNYASSCLKENKTLDEKWFDEQMQEWEWKWVNKHEAYTEIPEGNTVNAVNLLYKKYAFLFE